LARIPAPCPPQVTSDFPFYHILNIDFHALWNPKLHGQYYFLYLFILVVSLNLSSNAPLYVFLLVQKKQLGVVISCKMPAGEIRTVKEYKDSLTKSMLHSALNQRLLKPSQERSLCFHFPSGVDALILLVKS
jgi:hypothetical protein